jgi:hypothetical protein
MPHGPQEGAVRLTGLPSLYVEGSSQWVTVAWEDGDTRHPLGAGVPEALSSSITGFLEAIRSGAVTSESAEWVLSVSGPNRALFGKPGPDGGEVSLIWQPAADGTEGVTQTVTLADLETWPGSLDLYGPADPDEVRSPKVYER